MDVEGIDAAQKLAILAQIAFGMAVPLSAIDRRGISAVDATDIRFAGELGYVIRLLAESWLDKGQIAFHVSPVFLRKSSPLAQVRGPYNAIYVNCDAVGDTLFYGRGAGQMPTASAVTADIIDLAIGRSQRTFQTLRLWTRNGERLELRPPETVRTRFYLRAMVADKPGTLSEVCGVLASQQVSIASVIQHEVPDAEDQRVQLVIMTHNSPTGNFRAACERLNQLSCVSGPCVYYPVED
ncbi:MAG: homoserine dehydrogenase [Planctomycetia bacterium]|nr:homoserine dehydrogenase [Planctomycetia bacterium]